MSAGSDDAPLLAAIERWRRAAPQRDAAAADGFIDDLLSWIVAAPAATAAGLGAKLMLLADFPDDFDSGVEWLVECACRDLAAWPPPRR